MKRRVTSTESLYLAVEKSIGTFSMLRVMLGTFSDREGSLALLRKHWNLACEMHPQFRFVLKGNYWVDPSNDHQPDFEVVNEAIELTKIPHLKPLDFHQSAVRLWVFQNGLIFQAAHALTDGMGLQNLIRDFFKIMKVDHANPIFGAESAGNTADQSTLDGDYAQSHGSYGTFINEREFALRHIDKPKGFMPKLDKRFRMQSEHPNQRLRNQASWIYHQGRIEPTLSGITEKELLAKLILTTAKWMQQIHPNTSVRCMVPVDLRKYEPTLKMDGNLSLPLWLELTGDESVHVVSEDLRNRIKRKEPLYNAEGWIMDFVGFRQLRKVFFLLLTRWGHYRKRYALNLIVSFMGKQKSIDYGFDGFDCDTVWSTAVYSGICPMQLNVTFDERHINYCISYHSQLFKPEQMHDLFELFAKPSDL
jgi:hypothetical protein